MLKILEITGEKFSASLRSLQNMHPNYADTILQFLSQIKELREMQSNALVLVDDLHISFCFPYSYKMNAIVLDIHNYNSLIWHCIQLVLNS